MGRWEDLMGLLQQDPNSNMIMPPAALSAAEATRQQLNPTGAGILTEAATSPSYGWMDNMGETDEYAVPMPEQSFIGDTLDYWGDAFANASELSPEAEADLAREAEEFDAVGFQNPEWAITAPDLSQVPASNLPPSGDVAEPVAPEAAPSPAGPTDVKQAATQAAAQTIEANATKASENAIRAYMKDSTDAHAAALNKSQEEEYGFWEMVKGVGEFLGEGVEIGWKQWQNLSPSTKIALIGTAAGAYSYSRGWDKTTGDIAQYTIGLYDQERKADIGEKAGQAEANKALALEQYQQGKMDERTAAEILGRETVARINAGAKITAAELGDSGTGGGKVSTASIESLGKSDAFRKAAGEPGAVYGTNEMGESDALALANVLHGMWKNSEYSKTMPYEQFAMNKKAIDQAKGILSGQGMTFNY